MVGLSQSEALHRWCRHVNKKALDQYVNFTDQKEELLRRHEDNVRGKDKIQQLIHSLDLRKDEAIERTFKVGGPASLCFCSSSAAHGAFYIESDTALTAVWHLDQYIQGQQI